MGADGVEDAKTSACPEQTEGQERSEQGVEPGSDLQSAVPADESKKNLRRDQQNNAGRINCACPAGLCFEGFASGGAQGMTNKTGDHQGLGGNDQRREPSQTA